MTTRTESIAAWWHHAIIYETHLPVFQDGDGDGIGDLRGLASRLDYLRDVLGVDAIWTGPFFRSPLLDQGFDVSDYLDVEPVFGTLDDFDALVMAAHERGMRVLIDYIPNHTSDQHPWFVASRSSRDNPYADWYYWRDPASDGGPPNNWTSEAGGSTWEYDDVRGQYYLHSHLIEQPDLNWRNPAVQDALLDVLRFWLARGADGVRIDVAHMLMKHPDMPDHPLEDSADNSADLQHADFGTQRHIYDRRHPDTHDALRRIRETVDEFDSRLTIAEIEAMPWPDWAEYYGSDLGGMHLPFPFRLLETPWDAAALSSELRDLYAHIPADAWPILALGNHDRSRLATRLGTAQARNAAILLLTLRGVPCLFAGDELGLEDRPVPLERQRDEFARTEGGKSRDVARIPMPWEPGPTGGFSSASPDDTWLPVLDDIGGQNVVAQLADPASLLTLYRTLAAARAASAALRDGDVEVDPVPDGSALLTFRRLGGGERIEVALNLGGSDVILGAPVSGQVVAATDPARRGEVVLDRLCPNEGVVIRTEG